MPEHHSDIAPNPQPTIPAMSPFGVAAERLFDMGYSPIPIMPRDKKPGTYDGRWKPMTGWGTVSVDDDSIATWSAWPGANIGVRHSDNFIGIDLDSHPQYAECHAAIRAVLAALPGTPVIRQGKPGGTVAYFRAEGVSTKVYKVKDAPNLLEVLARGRQSLVPRSIHPEGHVYQWLTDDTLETVPAADLPLITAETIAEIETILRAHGWDAAPTPASKGKVKRPDNGADLAHDYESASVYDLVNRRAMRDLSGWVPMLNLYRCEPKAGGYHAVPIWRPSNTGNENSKRKRNLSIVSDGIKDFGAEEKFTPIDLVMKAQGIDADAAWSWLWNLVGEKLPPWSPTRKIIEADPARAREIIAEVEREKAEMRIPGVPDDCRPYDGHEAGGLIRVMADWTQMRSQQPSPELAMFAGIMTAAALFGRKFLTPTGAGLNLYSMVIAPSGYGKEAPLAAVKAVLGRGSLKRCLGPDGVTSDAALHALLRKRPSCVTTIDEAGFFIGGAQGFRASSHEVKILPTMLSLYGSSAGQWAGTFNASKEDTRETLYKPTLSVLGVTTPGPLFGGLNSGNLDDGLLARFLYVGLDTCPASRSVFAKLGLEVTDELQELVNNAFMLGMGEGNAAQVKWESGEVEVEAKALPWANDQAAYAWEAIKLWERAIMLAKPGIAGILNRSAENTVRLASLRALSRAVYEGGDYPTVTVEDVTWGAAIVERSIATILSGLDKHSSANEYDKLQKKLLAVIKTETATKRFEGGVGMGQLLNRVKHPQRVLDEALSALVTMGKVLEVPMERGGAAGKRKYKLAA